MAAKDGRFLATGKAQHGRPNRRARTGVKAKEGDGQFSTSLVKGLSILATFSASEPLLGSSELARRLDINRTTTHRYLSTLKMLGYVEQDRGTRKYRLAVRAVDLGLAALNSMETRHIAKPYLDGLCEDFGNTVNMGVLDNDSMVFIERVRAPGGIDLNLNIGSRQPAYCTSMGKVLLAHLPAARLEEVLGHLRFLPRGPRAIASLPALRAELQRVRRAGFALNDEELMAGLRSMAFPIWSGSGEVIAAINMAVHASTTTAEELVGRYRLPLEAASKEISKKLGFQESVTEQRAKK